MNEQEQDSNEWIRKKIAAEMIITHIQTIIKMGIIAILIPFISIAFYMTLGEHAALITWIISFIYIGYILFKSRKYQDYLIQKYDLQHLIKKPEQQKGEGVIQWMNR